MPRYDFKCKSCKITYEELTNWDATGKYLSIKCPNCNSKKKEQIPVCCAEVVFTNPRGTSKADKFSYVAGYNMENAKETRRIAEAKSHMGRTDEIYRNIDDISSGKNEDFNNI